MLSCWDEKQRSLTGQLGNIFHRCLFSSFLFFLVSEAQRPIPPKPCGYIIEIETWEQLTIHVSFRSDLPFFATCAVVPRMG
jgi:hypothetical protein